MEWHELGLCHPKSDGRSPKRLPTRAGQNPKTNRSDHQREIGKGVTAEIAIMNRFGVALAADSAATVSYWQNGERLTRYLKGANKIFNISTSHPVGAMIYDAGSLQGMPWEIVLKAYRDSAASKANDLLEGYAKDLFDFIVTNGHLFPQAYQDRQLIEALADVIGRITYVITRPRGDSGRQSRIPRTSSRSTIASNFR